METLIINIRQSCSEAVATLIKMGSILTKFQEIFSRYPVEEMFGTGFTAETLCGVTGPEALLLTRSAAARPAWKDPTAVDLIDPLANELLELAVAWATRALPNAQEVA